jgi:polysaccharide biosynthesis transport protein
MSDKAPVTRHEGLSLVDCYYILFRRKRLILSGLILGITLAIIQFLITPRQYTSTAKIMVRYVVDSPALQDAGEPARSTSTQGESLLNSEMEILTSRDLVEGVAAVVGPGKILGGTGRTNLAEAVGVISKGLRVDAPRRSNIIAVSITHTDSEVAQAALGALVTAYKKRHAEIHRNLGADDSLTPQVDALRDRLNSTEEELRKLKAKAGIMSIEDGKQAINQEIQMIRNSLLATETELVTQVAVLDQLDPQRGTNSLSTNFNLGSSTNAVMAPLQRDIYQDYSLLLYRMDAVKKKRADLLISFTDDNPSIKKLDEQYAQLVEQKRALELKEPKLEALGLVFLDGQKAAAPGSGSSPLVNDRIRIVGLLAKMKILNTQLEKLKADAAVMDETAYKIAQLQRKRDLEETNYRHFYVNLEQARFDLALSSDKRSNISMVQAPSVALNETKNLFKKMAIAFMGPTCAGLALAFVIELIFIQTIRRPSDVEDKLSIPLLVTIPEITVNDRPMLSAPPPEPASDEKAAPLTVLDATQMGIQTSILKSYMQVLRDRILFSDARNGVPPRFIGVTACSEGAGTTTIAVGLAQSLAETSGGKILLVDLSKGREEPAKSAPTKHIPSLVDILEASNSKTTLVLRNFFLVSDIANDDSPQSLSPAKFQAMLQKLESTNYAQVIFDLPVVSSNSVTSLLTRFLQMNVLVVESERTPTLLVKRARAGLSSGKVNFGVVLNRYRNYIPSWLHPEL